MHCQQELVLFTMWLDTMEPTYSINFSAVISKTNMTPYVERKVGIHNNEYTTRQVPRNNGKGK